MASSEAMTSSTHSFAYSYRLVKKCFVKICETLNCHNFLIFQPIFIRFSLFCSENFTLSSKIKLDLLRTSPLSIDFGLRARDVRARSHAHNILHPSPQNENHRSALASGEIRVEWSNCVWCGETRHMQEYEIGDYRL